MQILLKRLKKWNQNINESDPLAYIESIPIKETRMFVKAILKIKLSEVFHRTTNYCFNDTELIPNPFFLESLKSNKNLKVFC